MFRKFPVVSMPPNTPSGGSPFHLLVDLEKWAFYFQREFKNKYYNFNTPLIYFKQIFLINN
jgi:hypothetical protein